MIIFSLNKIALNLLILKKIQNNFLKKITFIKIINSSNYPNKTKFKLFLKNYIFLDLFIKNYIFFFFNNLNNSIFLVNNEYNNLYVNLILKNSFFKNSIYFNYFDNNFFFFYRIFNPFYLKPYFFKRNKENKKIKSNPIKHNMSFVNNLIKTKKKSFNFKSFNISKQCFKHINYNCIFFNKKNTNKNITNNDFYFTSLIKNKLAFNLKNDLFFFKKITFFNFKKKRIITNTTKFILNESFIINKIPLKNSTSFLNHAIFSFSDLQVFVNKVKKINFFLVKSLYLNFIPFYRHFLMFKKFKNLKSNLNKKYNKNFITLNRNIMFLNDIHQSYNYPILNKKIKILSNKHISKNINYFNIGFNNFKKNNINEKQFNIYNYNNHYPVILHRNFDIFLEKFKKGLSLNYYNFMQVYTINFLEYLLNKRVFLRITNNFFKKYPFKNYLMKIFEENRYNNPIFFKKFLLVDFIEIIWYSFYLKDLKMISTLISHIMESMHFRHHRKFLLFFQNFMKKYYSIFITILGIKGFFFDIRGKVGVAGNSKKRHFFFKFGNLGKSSKINKIDFNQNLVRTPSGVLGLTYILNY